MCNINFVTDFCKMLPISVIPLFGYEHHNKYKPIYYDTVFSLCIVIVYHIMT